MKNGELRWPDDKVNRDGHVVTRDGLALGLELEGSSVIIVGPDLAAIEKCADHLRLTFDERKLRTASVAIAGSRTSAEVAS